MSRPCASALRVPPRVKTYDDCMTLTARPRGFSYCCTSSQVAPAWAVSVLAFSSRASIRLKPFMSKTRAPSVYVCPPGYDGCPRSRP